MFVSSECTVPGCDGLGSWTLVWTISAYIELVTMAPETDLRLAGLATTRPRHCSTLLHYYQQKHQDTFSYELFQANSDHFDI